MSTLKDNINFEKTIHGKKSNEWWCYLSDKKRRVFLSCYGLNAFEKTIQKKGLDEMEIWGVETSPSQRAIYFMVDKEEKKDEENY